MTQARHLPVLRDEALGFLAPAPGMRIIDGTFGFGGHSRAMLAAGAEVLGLDLDAQAVQACRELTGEYPGLACRHTSFRRLDEAARSQGWTAVQGALLDLGVSSPQLDDPAKGFSYRTDGPLDLRYDRSAGRPASALLQELSEGELADLFFKWGEEKASRRIARAVVRQRALQPVDTTAELRQVVQSALPRGLKPEPVLSRIFQALRIAVNEELAALQETLDKLPGLLCPGGRFVVISYHSLEDRLVKRFIDRERRDCLCPPQVPVCACGHTRSLLPLTRKAVQASAAEQAANPRSRSARLRAAQKI